jgi:DNA topoisomerase-1
LDCAGDSAAAASKTTPELFSSMSMRFQSSRNIQYNYIQSMVGFTNKHSRYTEASLISKLEDLGIGRPSTFSMLVDVIQTRKYVEKKDIEGTKQTCVEFMLTGENEIKEKVCEKVVGAEYKKLVIDPVGTVAIEFLLKSFDSLFSYNYTKELEERLDRVAAGEELWYKVCEDCYREMKQQIKRIGKGDKKTYALADTDEYVLVFCKATTANKNSFVLKDKKAAGVYKTVKSDFKFDMEKLEAGAYTYEELAEIEDRVLGLWNDQEIKLRVGKFGPYLEYGDDKIRVSLKQESIPKPLDKIELKDVLSSLEKESVLRVLTPEISIRKSKYGPYIYYKTEKMKKPKFFDLKKYTDDVMKSESHELVEWITKTHLS